MASADDADRSAGGRCALHAVLAACALAAAGLPGCSRGHYRRDADRETYQILADKTEASQQAIPSLSIEPASSSRLADPTDRDHPPLPPDDPIAHRVMHCPNCLRGSCSWHKDGDAPSIENASWRDALSLAADGQLALTPERAVELGIENSREYQAALEDLYLSALALSLNRYEFALHWFARTTTFYDHFGTSSTPPGGNESNTLTTSSDIGFTRALATGGQLLVDFANTFVWEFTGANTRTATSSIGVHFLQPVLRRAGREVRLEALTQGERNVLYAVRDFARFRKQFYVAVTTGQGGYLSLLLQLQNIRNFEANVASLERNLRLYEALQEIGNVSTIQVDQVFQSYQTGRLNLTQATAGFETLLDSYKLTLGLPPGVPTALDDTLLAPFQLNDPELTRLQEESDRFVAQYREAEQAPSLAELRTGIDDLRALHERLGKLLDQAGEELERWGTRISDAAEPTGTTRGFSERAAYDELRERIAELVIDFEELGETIAKAAEQFAEEHRTQNWELLQKLSRQESSLEAELFVLQTQTRVYLIRLKPVDIDLASAIAYARENRLDLLNERARGVDEWRRITVAADALEADLDLFFDANIATPPGGNNPLAFSSSASSYRVGFRFDGPLDRKAERNLYRTQLVRYQRQRRSYTGLADRIEQALRRDLRQLETDRLNFYIARESLIIAARQVEQTRDQLLVDVNARGTTATQDVLQALNQLLQAKNTLISTWVSYESGRMQLLLDLEALELDDRGLYNEARAGRLARPGSGQPAPRGDRMEPIASATARP